MTANTKDEDAKHVAAIDRIAASIHLPREQVARLYERVLAKMQQKATIKTFLAIFAARRVDKVLRRMNGRHHRLLWRLLHDRAPRDRVATTERDSTGLRPIAVTPHQA